MTKQSFTVVLLFALFALPVLGGEIDAPLDVTALAAGHLVPQPGAGMLFGTSDRSPSDFITIDLAAGTGALIGPMVDSGANPNPGPPPPGVFDALATDPFTDLVYASGQGPGLSSPRLFLVDISTGAVTRIDSVGIPLTGVAGTLSALDFRADGTLFAAIHNWRDAGRGAANFLATLDVVTGDAAIVGPFGECPVPGTGGPGSLCTIEDITGLAFDTAGTLWAVKGDAMPGNGEAGLYTVDPATGAAAFVGPVLDAVGNPPSGGMESLQLRCDGTLFGGTGAGRLVTIDRVTLEFKPVDGGVVTPGGEGLVGLAFSMSSCSPVQSITGLIRDVHALQAIGTIHRSVGEPLRSLLRHAERAIARGQVETGALALRIAKVLVSIGERQGIVPAQTAQGLRAALNRIVGAL